MMLRPAVLFVGDVDEVVGLVLRDQVANPLDCCLVADDEDAAVAGELELRAVEVSLLGEPTNRVHRLFYSADRPPVYTRPNEQSGLGVTASTHQRWTGTNHRPCGNPFLPKREPQAPKADSAAGESWPTSAA